MGDLITRIGRGLKEHFSEILLCGVLFLMLWFVVFMSHIHNDSLASKGTDFAGQVLAALLTLLTASRINQGGPPHA